MKYSLSSFKGDFLGGITAGVIGLPLCLAFGAASGLGPIAGLYGGITLGILAAVFGGTPTQISAPTGPMTVLSTLIISHEIYIFGSLEKALGAILLTFILAGVFQIILGVLRLGKYINYLPYPVISGFMSGIGVIVIAMQFQHLFGSSVKSPTVIDCFMNLPMYVSQMNWQALLIGVITLATVFLTPKVTKHVPAPLVGLAVGTGLSILFKFDIKTIGEIPTALPTLHLDTIFGIDKTRITHIILPAISLGALGMIDTLLTSVIADKVTKTKHESNRELIGQGIGNIGAAIIGGIPGAGTTTVTLANIKTGASTRLSGVFQGLFILMILMFGAKYAANIPYAVLAGLLVSIGFNIMDYSVFRELKIIPQSDKLIIFIVLILTIVWDLLYATGIGFMLSSIFFMKKMADTIDRDSKESKIDNISSKLLSFFDDADKFRKDVYIKTLRGPIFFGFANRLEDDIKKIPNIRCLIMDFKDVPYMDQTGLYSVRDAIIDLKNSGISVCLTQLNKDCKHMLIGVGIIPEFVPRSNVFYNIEDCIIWVHDHLDNHQLMSELEIDIPSAFTPNEDGSNDSWKIAGLEKYPNCMIQVLNDANEVLYNSNGYNKPWDGKKENHLVPTGKYKYHIKLDDNVHVEGSLILVR